MFMQAQPQAPPAQVMQVQVPMGLQPGGTFLANTPMGPVQATVPYGVQGGMMMTISVPMNAGGQGMPTAPQPQMMVMMQPQPQVMVPMQQPSPMMMMPQMQSIVGSAVSASPPQPMVMQQQAPPPQQATPPVAPAKEDGAAKRGAPGLLIYQVNIHPLGDCNSCETCCDKSSSPVGQLEAKKMEGAPEELKGVMSNEAWELVVENLAKWQDQLPCQMVPCCELCCLAPPCLPFLCCAYASRKSWERAQAEKINEMLEKYHCKLHFEREGCTPYAKVVWA